MKKAPLRLQTTLGLNSVPAHLEPPPRGMRSRKFQFALCAAIWAVLSLAGAGRALATLTVSPTTITNDYTGEIDLNITGLNSTGQTVVIEKYFDADGSNTINAGDILVAQYQVTDGLVTSIASHRNLNVPGDDDGAADGKILTKLHGDPQDTIGMLDGQFIFRVRPSGTGFTPFTATLVVTQKDYGGSGLSGTVSVSGTPQAGALVLISSTGSSNKGPVGFTSADATGHFSIKVPAGSYQLWGVKSGFVYNVGAAPALAVSAGSFLSGQSVPLVASGRTISGTVSDSVAPHQPLPGVAVIAQSTDGMLSITFADGSGNFTVDATAGQWKLQTDSALTTRLGFLKGKTSDSSSGNVTAFNFAVQRVTALIYGTVADSGANPLAGIQLNANDGTNTYDINATSDASGHYSLGVVAGSWYASISNSSPGLAGYVVPNSQSVTISDAQAVQAGFTLLAANAHLQGVVTNNGTPVPAIQLSAYNQSTNQSVNGQTAADGTFALGLAPGTWSVQIESSSATSFNVVSPSINYTLTAGQTLSGITFTVASVTGHVAGTVKDGLNNPVSGVQVSGNATVAGTNYSSSATTDSGGNYSVPVCAGTWNVGVSSYDLQAKGFLAPSNQNATVSTGTATLNFIVLSPTSTIYGSVKTPTGTPVPSVPVTARQMGGAGVQINGQTDASGNYSLGVTTGSWDVGPEFTAGYVPQRQNVIVNTDGSNVLQNLIDHPVTAHLRGQIRDNHNNPVGNLEILAVDNNFNNTNVSATSDANGNFDLAVYGGEGVGLTKQWTLQIPEGNVGTPSPYVSSVVSFQVQDSVDINNIAYVVYLITAHLRGQVLDENNAPVPNIAIGASNQSIAANTGSGVDASGNFDIPIFGGTWGLGLSLIQGLGLIQQNELISVTDGVDQNSLVIRARHTTAAIAGYVKDTQNNPVGGVQVFGNISVAGVNYSTSTSTDSGGNYSLPVFSGTWDVGVSGNDLQSRGYQPPADQNVFANTSTVTLNFIVSSGTMATLAATNITGTGATLNGSVNPGGVSTAVSFDYGLTNSYGSNIAAVPSPISGSGPTSVSAVLTGLSPGTTYHYRVVATNTGGTSSGSDMSFTAASGSSVAPTITSQPVNQTVTAGQGTAFIVAASGTPMPTFQWQVSTDGGTNWNNLNNDSTYSGVSTSTLTLASTIVGQNGYRYRAVATNTVGPATSNNALLTVNVMSGAPTLASIAVTPTNPTISVGSNQPFTATGTFSDGSSRTLISGNGNWATKASLPARQSGLTCGVVNGVLYAVGGTYPGGSAAVYGYNPANDSWTPMASMPTARQYPGIGVVNGILYAVGGSGGGIRATVEAYDPNLNTWSTKTSMPTARDRAGVAVVNGILYAIGGYNSNDLATVEAYDPGTDTWSTKTPMPITNKNFAIGVVNGIIYVAGGDRLGIGGVSDVYSYNPATDAWATMAPMPAALFGLRAGTVHGILYVVGGSYPNVTTVEAYDPVANTWTTKNPMSTARYDFGAGVVDGVLYVAGGYNNGLGALASVEAYSPAEVAWSSNSTSVATIDVTGNASALSTGASTISASAGSITGSTQLTVVPPPPAITTPPVNQTMTAGQTATFTVVANGTPPLTYQWQKNGTPINGATGTTLTLDNVQLSDVGYYTVVVGSGSGSTTSGEAALTLPSFPIATTANSEMSIGGAFDGTNFLVAIQGDAANSTDISAQLVSQTGTLVGPRIAVGRTGGMPWVAFDGTNYLMVWEDDATYPVNRLWGAFVSPSGALVGSAFAFPVRAGASTRQAPQGIAFDGTNYLVTYTDNHDAGWPDLGGDYYNSANLCARFVTPGGTVGDEIVLATNAKQSKQTVAWNGSTYFVAWPAHIGGNQNIVQGRTVSTTGVMSSLITIDGAVSLDQNPLSVATDGTNFLVVWNYDASVDLQGNAIWELRGRVVSTTGVLLGSQIPVADTSTRPMFPGIMFDGANYLVAWTAQHGSGNLDIAGCYFNSGGAPQGSAFSIAVGSGNQGLPLLVAGAGKRLVGWTDGLGMSSGMTGGDVRGTFLQGPALPTVTHFTLGKWVDYLQNSAAVPVPSMTLSDPAGNFGFSAEISGSNLTGLSPTPGITLPGGATYPLAYQDGQWKFVATTHNFASQSALDAAFPDGTYTMNIGSLASNVPMGLTPDSYPNTPAVVNGAWDASGNLLVNTGADSTIHFNTFANYSNGGAVEFKIFTFGSDGQGHSFVNQKVVSALNISAHGDPVLASYTIPSGTLLPNQVYYAEVSFDQLINIDTSSIPGAFGGADFARHTGFYISTFLASGPTITLQPVNQTVSPGQNATFTVAANGTPAPTLQWQVSTDGGTNWNSLVNDPTSSGVTQATLTVAADSSLNGYQYRCVATNIAGPATSNAATLTVNTPPAQFAAVQFFGGAGDQRGTGITIVGGNIYVTGNAQPESQNNADSALVARYAIPFGGPPVWSRSFGSGSLLYGVAATSTGIFGAGASYTLTTDAVGGKEDKTILAKFAPDGTSGTGPGGSAWVAGSGGTTGLSAFFAYGGVEMFRAVAVNTEAGAPVVYAAGFGQPASYSACLVAKFDAAGNRLAAATDSAAGLSLSRVSIPSPGGSSANGVAVLGGSVYAAGSTGWAIEDATGRPVVWIYDQSLALKLRQRDTSLSGGFNAITAAGGALYAAGYVFTPGVTGSENYLVQKFDPAGNRLWSATWGGTATDVLTGVVGVGNRVFVSGYTKSQGSGGFDGVLCEIDPRTGSLLSTVLIGGAQDDMANGLATDGTDLYVVGETRSFPSGTNAAGQNDGFVARYVLGGTTPAPSVTTTGATSITATGATFNATVNANGADTAVSFDYGLSSSYGSNIAATPSPVTGNGDTAVSAVVSGLLPSTTYHYRARGGSVGGAAQGADATFTTPSNVATLSKLVLSTGTLSPAFASTTTNYSASVANGTPSITVTPTVTQGQATVQVNGNTVASTAASGPISLSAGGTLITVVVTAQDGTTSQTYTIAVFAPLIAVQQPAGNGLVDGAASRDFGGIAPGKTGTLMFTVKNTGKAVLNSFGLTFDGANPGDFSVTTPPAASVAAGGSTTFTVTFTPGAPEVRTATLHIASNDLVHSPFDIALTGTGAVLPSITTPPASLLAGVGQPVSLTVTADGGASSYQWLKNNVPVPGATSSTYSLTAALTNAGAYTVKVTNAAGSVTSVAANLGVVNVTPATVTVVSGNTMTLTAVASGPGLTYQWLLNGSTTIQNGPNPANSLGVISGATTPTLTITKTIPADANTYTCVVTMPDPQHSSTPLSLASGAFTVNVTAKPVLNAFAPGPWIVSGTVTDVITAQNNPTSFTVIGLPTGVTVNPKTGQFGGKPLVNVTTATLYPLTVTASNAAGISTPLKVSVTVNPLPANAIGTFNGLVDRDDTLTLGYGGTFSVSSTNVGSFTGKLTLGALSYPFIAQQLDAAVGGSSSATVVISRKLLPSLIISFVIDQASGELTGSVTDGVIATPVAIDAWRNPWNATSNKAPQAAIYNSQLTLDPAVTGTGTNPGNIIYPQGTSFGTLTVNSAGAANWTGKMADGAVTTCSVTMGPNGEVPLHFMLYTNTGSAHGWVKASGSDPGLLLDTMGTFDWMKSPQTNATLTYKNGFALQNLTVVGAKYIKPTTASPLVMGIGPASGTNAQLLFSEGGLLALSYVGPPAVSIAAAANIADLTNHSAVLVTGTVTATAMSNSVSLPSPNPANLVVTINASTGAFSGTFILHGDQDPTKTVSTLINRTGTFSGLCITRNTGSPTLNQGVGYFLLPELQPYPGLSVATAPLLSGKIVFH